MHDIYTVKVLGIIGRADVGIRVKGIKDLKVRTFLATKVVIPLLSYSMRVLLWLVGFEVDIEIDWQLK